VTQAAKLPGHSIEFALQILLQVYCVYMRMCIFIVGSQVALYVITRYEDSAAKILNY